MKHFFTIIFSIILFSCSKEPNAPNPVQGATGSVQYKVNGNLVVYNNVDLLSGQYTIFYKQLAPLLGKTRYALVAQQGSNNIIEFAVISDSLSTGNYHYDSLSVYRDQLPVLFSQVYKAQFSGLLYNGDYLDINISSYNEGKISGTFSGKISPDYQTKGTTLITEGKISNVQVVY